MKSERVWHNPIIDQSVIDRVKSELGELDREFVEVAGKRLKPSQCYRFETNPLHVLFNTNCPDSLKERVETILFKYLPDENSTP
jgi:hypothetical protein